MFRIHRILHHLGIRPISNTQYLIPVLNIGIRSIPNTRYLILILTLWSIISFAQGETTFKEANTLYNQERYEEAIKAYTSILESGETSAALYYNLANAYYKINAMGKSIYYYEKGLQLAPQDADIQNNLAIANKAIVDVIETVPEGFISRFFKGITYSLTVDQWAWVSVVAIVLFVIGYVVYYTTRTALRKRIFFISSVIALCMSILSVCFAWVQYSNAKNTTYAIVFSTKTAVKSEPNLRSESVFELHEGTKVRILEQLNNWNKIRLADGKIGWIPKTEIKAL